MELKNNHNVSSNLKNDSGTGSAYKVTNHNSNVKVSSSDSTSLKEKAPAVKSSKSHSNTNIHNKKNGVTVQNNSNSQNNTNYIPSSAYSSNNQVSKPSVISKKQIRGTKPVATNTIMRLRRGFVSSAEKKANQDASTDTGYTSGVALATGGLKAKTEATTLSSVAKSSKKTAIDSLAKTKKAVKSFNVERNRFKKANSTVAKIKGSNPFQKNLTKRSIIKKSASKTAVKSFSKAASAFIKTIRYAIAAIKNIIMYVASGSISTLFLVLAVGVVIIILASPFGIMFSNDDGALTDIINEVNDEYWQKIDYIKTNNTHDSFNISGTPVEWKDVLLVYCAKYTEAVNDEATFFAQLDDVAKEKLSELFWDMCNISYSSESETYEHKGKSYTYTTLTIEVSSTTAIEYAQNNGFSEEQISLIKEMSEPQYDSMWSQLLVGISSLSFLNPGDFPFFDQTDYGHIPYGEGTIADCGCGPTAFAMVVSYLTGTTITPADIVAWCGNDYYVYGSGTAWSLFGDAANHYGIKLETFTTDIDVAIEALSQGKPVINAQGPGRFTTGGHFIVLRGIDKNGKILVYDPNNGDMDENNISFSKDEISAGSGQEEYWIFSSDLITGGNVALQVWNFLKSNGYSDEVAAGIIGNMMRECGGDTLDLQWNLHGYYRGDTFYGLCMWCLRFSPGIDGTSVISQLNYLKKDIKYQIDTFGFQYYSGFNYNKFVRLKDPEAVAVAFAACYERPGPEANNYQLRRQNAVVAYNTFSK